MAVVGVVVEYNPLHNGHLWQIQQIKQQLKPEVLVVVMSGNFVQRGELALIDKWARTKMALAAGVDLVIELPIYGAVQPADIFAEEAMIIMQNLQVTDLVFGTENESLDYKTVGKQIANLSSQTGDFSDYRNTYATQLNQVLERELGVNLTKPNELLGVAYAQAAQKLKYNVNLVPLQRFGQAEHDQPQMLGEYSSASAIRQALLTGQDYKMALPDFTHEILTTAKTFDWELVFPYLKYRLMSSSLLELKQIYQMSEGLQHKLKQEIKASTSFADFLCRIKSKRFTFARLRRLCLYVLLNISAEQMEYMRHHRYLHVLGFNDVGQVHLRHIRRQAQLPLITKVTQNLGRTSGIMAPEVQIDQILQLFDQTEQNFGRQPITMRK